MHELKGMMLCTYASDRVGGAQLWTLCASVLLPRKISDADLQHAANELFRINDELRVRFVEDDANKAVYQEILPFRERVFDTLTFDSKDDLDAWGYKFGAIPLMLDVRAEGKKGISTQYWLDLLRIKPSVKDIATSLVNSLSLSMQKRKLHIKQVPSCCEIKLVQLPDASGALVKVHHIVSDAWSMALMANQFLQILNGETPVAYSYEEHLASDEAYRQSKAYKRDVAFFEKQHENVPLSILPKSWAAKRKTAIIDESLTSAMTDYSQAHNITPYTLLLTAMGIYMRCREGNEKAFVGSACANRIGAHEKSMVGLFYNIPALLLELDASASFADTIAAVNSANFTCMRHQKACFDVPDPTPFKYVVSYQNAIIEADSSAVCTQYYCDAFSYCMISIEDRQNEGRFKLYLDYNTEMCPDDQEMDELLDYVIAAIREGVANDTKPINQLVM